MHGYSLGVPCQEQDGNSNGYSYFWLTEGWCLDNFHTSSHTSSAKEGYAVSDFAMLW